VGAVELVETLVEEGGAEDDEIIVDEALEPELSVDALEVELGTEAEGIDVDVLEETIELEDTMLVEESTAEETAVLGETVDVSLLEFRNTGRHSSERP
jgi:hypothetical protein